MVSVIVPVYCVEDRLRRCVDSILNQTLRDLEVILVDDGSPDGCGAICDEYADRDSRVRVIHKANGGLSSARNAGLEVCRGEYVAFVDSDDWLETDMLQLLLDSCLQYGAQIAECGYRSIYSDRTEDSCPDDGEVLQADGLRAVKGLLEWTDFSTVAWNKLYLYNVIKNIRYPEGKLHEDEFTTYRIFLQAEKLYLSAGSNITTTAPEREASPPGLFRCGSWMPVRQRSGGGMPCTNWPQTSRCPKVLPTPIAGCCWTGCTPAGRRGCSSSPPCRICWSRPNGKRNITAAIRLRRSIGGSWNFCPKRGWMHSENAGIPAGRGKRTRLACGAGC